MRDTRQRCGLTVESVDDKAVAQTVGALSPLRVAWDGAGTVTLAVGADDADGVAVAVDSCRKKQKVSL